MPKSPHDKPSRGFEAVVLVGQVGIAGALPIVLGVMAGVYLEGRIGGALGGLALMGCIFLGIAGGIVSVYRLIKPFLN